MRNTNAHIVAMTGSYFRGDAVPVLDARGRGEVHARSPTTTTSSSTATRTSSRSASATTSTRAATPTPSTRFSTPTRRRSCTSRMCSQASRRRTSSDEVDAIFDSYRRSRSPGRDDRRDSRQAQRATASSSRSPISSMTTRAQRNKIVEYLRTMDVARRHRPDHRPGDGEGGLRLAVLRARADRRIPRLADRDHPDHRSLPPATSPNKTHAQFTNLIAQPDAARRRGQGRRQQHAQGDHGVAADGAGARAELQVQDEALRG